MERNTGNITAKQLYTILFEAFGPQEWWPMDHTHHTQNKTDPRFEVMIGAILTQNTAWNNVEKAIQQLKKHDLLHIQGLIHANIDTIKQSIRSSGYYNQKAKRLHHIAQHLQVKYNGNLDRFFAQSTSALRNELLSLHGIGPETADSIMLYAAEKPVFVVDAYTKRLCKRLPLPVNAESYQAIQHYFETHLKKTYAPQEIVQVYNEFHALIVNVGKHYCKPNPLCMQCPLLPFCEFGTKNKRKN